MKKYTVFDFYGVPCTTFKAKGFRMALRMARKKYGEGAKVEKVI